MQFSSIRFNGGRPLLKEVTAERLNAILTEIRRNRPLPGRGITTRATGDGIAIDLAAITGGAAVAPQPPQPWDLIARVDPDADPEDPNPDYLVTVTPGTISGILASNWDIEETLPSEGLHFAKIVLATDGTNITGVTIAIDTNAPTVQVPQEFSIEPSIEILFGLFADGKVYRVIDAGNIEVAPEVWMTKEKDSPAEAGELPYELFYRLQ